MSTNNKEKTFEVFRKFNLVFRNLHKQHMSSANKSMFSQGMILRILSVKPKISQKELFSLLDISKQSLSETLSKLEKDELIIRTSSEEDKRSQIIEITKKGQDIIKNHHRHSFHDSTVLDDFTEEELVIFSGYLDRILSKFDNTENCRDDFMERRKSFEKFMATLNK